jgi:SAM-dependent methyltransferase
VAQVWEWRYWITTHSILNELNTSLGLSTYVGIDIAKTSLVDFVDRLKALPLQSQSKILSLIEMDMGNLNSSLTTSQFATYTVQTQRWSTVIPFPVMVNQQKLEFDIASCQFAVHYMFQSRDKARHFFSQIHDQLAPLGVIVMTTVDSRMISNLVLKETTNFPVETENGKRSLRIYSEAPLSPPDSNGQGILL